MPDQWGHPFLYTSKSNGFFWEMADDPNEDQFFRPDERMTQNGDGSWSFESTEGLRPSLVRDTNFDKIGCDMNQADAAKRGFGWKEKTDFRDVEFKFVAKFTGGTSTKYMSPEMVTGRHSTDPCNEGSSYGFNFDYNVNPLRVRPFKEQYHSNYAHLDFLTKTSILNAKLSGLGRFVGFGIVRYNKTNTEGKTTVIIEAWINPDPDANKLNWLKFASVEDKGGWGTAGKTAKAENADQILTWAMPVAFRIKLQDGDLGFSIKQMSLREIDPFAANVPEDPSPNVQFGFAELQVKRHINTEKASACTIGGGAADVELYRQTGQNGDTDLKGTDYRAGERCNNSNSVLFNAIIKSGTVYLRKTGTVSNDTFLRIRKGSDNSLIRTLATIAAASINTSETAINFTDAGNTYRMQDEDMFSIEHNGSSSNYVSVFRNDSSGYDGTNSVRFTAKPTTPVEESGDLKAILNGQI